jgi:hypothetical protein
MQKYDTLWKKKILYSTMKSKLIFFNIKIINKI